MYDGDKAVLTMVQYLKEDKEKDENIYEATVIEYQKEMEQVHLILRSGSLSSPAPFHFCLFTAEVQSYTPHTAVTSTLLL